MPAVTLDRLFAPHTVDEFIRDSFGKRFELVRGWPGKFAELLPWEDLNRLLTEHTFDPMRLRLVKDGKPVPRPVYIQENPFPMVVPGELARELREGATLNLNMFHQMHGPVRQLTGALSRALQEPVTVNLYAGWRTTKGFDLHWDEHDVFVLQVAGRKAWKVYGDSRPHPISHALDGSFPPSQELVWEGVLNAGDLLYMPRGWWHVAVPMDEPSLHLSFGVDTHHGRSLLLWLVDEVAKSSAWTRKDLPRFATAAQRSEHLERMREDFLAQWTPDLLERFYAHLEAKAKPRPALGLPWSATAERIPPDDDHLVWLLVPGEPELTPLPEEGRVQLVANGRRFRFGASAQEVLEVLAARRPVSIAEVVRTVAGRVDRDTVRRLLAKLVEHGLLAVVGPAAPAAPNDAEPAGEPAAAAHP
ncbi:MAG TPA: cupin domain-containing protein [Longimicrobiaceae bacterium]|nr:cupin domain-containing protein [Longimicrobiaceae bacterium]